MIEWIFFVCWSLGDDSTSSSTYIFTTAERIVSGADVSTPHALGDIRYCSCGKLPLRSRISTSIKFWPLLLPSSCVPFLTCQFDFGNEDT